MIALRDFLALLTPPDRIRIIQDGQDVYTGFLGCLEYEEHANSLMDAGVVKYRTVTEITHRQWKDRGLQKPLQPDVLPEYAFSDLQMSIYNTFYIQRVNHGGNDSNGKDCGPTRI